MNSDKYFIVLSGTLIAGHQRRLVVEALAHLLRITSDKADVMLNGKRSRIRRPLSYEKAKHLRDKLAAAGAGSFIEPVNRASGPEPSMVNSDGEVLEDDSHS